MILNSKKRNKNLRIGDVLEEIVGGEVLDGDVGEVAGAAVDSAAAHGVEEDAVGVVEVPEVVHVDGAPDERVLRDVAPQRANALSVPHHIDCTYLHEYRRHHVSRQIQPVPVFLLHRILRWRLVRTRR